MEALKLIGQALLVALLICLKYMFLAFCLTAVCAIVFTTFCFSIAGIAIARVQDRRQIPAPKKAPRHKKWPITPIGNEPYSRKVVA